MANPAPLGAINAQQFAAPGLAIGAVAMAVERDADDGADRAVFGRDRRDMRDMVLYAHERQTGLLRIARRQIVGVHVAGDSFWRDEEDHYHFTARTDGIILSAGYNIAGPEVEAALLSHSDVLECAVVGAPDPERGQIVEAHVVLRAEAEPGESMVKVLQDHVKSTVAPYKYPRRIVFTQALPKNESGKIQRFRLLEGRN